MKIRREASLPVLPMDTPHSVDKQLPGHAFQIILNPSWVILIPLGGWVILTLYLPIFGGFLSQVDAWLVTLAILVLAALSLAGHAEAHNLAARGYASSFPGRIPLFLFGDAAQVWPEEESLWAEALAAAAGPLFNLLLAGGAYLLWNAQIDPFLNLTMLFTAAFNAWLAVINLIPAYPFDGGRLLRAFAQGIGANATAAAKLAQRMGYTTMALLAGWGAFLFAQQARFSLQTGGTTVFFALLIGLGLIAYRSSGAAPAKRLARVSLARPLRTGLLSLFVILFAIAPSGLIFTNQGVLAPGLALAVGPMVSVPAKYYHAHAGSFILTSVLEQAPILTAEWAAGKLDPAVKIVPAGQIVPENSTLQEQALQGYQMMDESEITAIVVGLRLAGYQASLVGKGAEVVSILSDSPSRSIIHLGDVITKLDGHMIQTSADLVSQIRSLTQAKTVHLQVERNHSLKELNVPLMPPDVSGGTPKIGIGVQTAGLDTHLPFPVQITPQKIVGGPSAGLMFTLTVYNDLSASDLTGGRKIAGTGTINPDGTVGPIGGVAEKVAAAEAAGATYFLCPVDNYAEALPAARHIKVIEIATAQQAVDFLRSLPRGSK